ncbi:MAG: V-type ATP synthase subunit F [Nanoarchaeales archaeon]|nr:V-type ATP synthase subunit F [Nanoarchaeales archaeon]
MAKITVCGDEEFTLGFELVGMDAYTMDKFETLISKNSDAGIVIISQDNYDSLSLKLKNTVDKLLKPIVVILSKEDIKGGNLRDSIIRALGVDLLK